MPPRLERRLSLGKQRSTVPEEVTKTTPFAGRRKDEALLDHFPKPAAARRSGTVGSFVEAHDSGMRNGKP